MTVYIYGLYASDDVTEEVRYIGKTTNLQKRMLGHRKDKRPSAKVSWIKTVHERGAEIKFLIIEEATESTWRELERIWIDALKHTNRLVNSTKGGESGLSGPRPLLSTNPDRRESTMPCLRCGKSFIVEERSVGYCSLYCRRRPYEVGFRGLSLSPTHSALAKTTEG